MSRMKHISTLAFSSLTFFFLSTSSHAAANGYYFGGQVGWGDIHQSGITGADINDLIRTALPGSIAVVSSDDTSDDDDGGIAGRLFVGYQWNCYWGAEFGWTKFHTMDTAASGNALDIFGRFITADASGTIKADAWDLTIKGTEPLEYGLSAYGKLGIAYLYERASASATMNVGSLTFSGHDSRSMSRVYPTFSLGVGYDITPQWVADVSWNRIQEVSNSELSSTDFWALGLSYHLGC